MDEVTRALLYEQCLYPGCSRDTHRDDSPPICTTHLIEVGAYFQIQLGIRLDAMPKESASRKAEREAWNERRATRLSEQSQVYYVRIGDYVKIGYTINMKARLSGLRVDPDAVLATEPGGVELESQRHRQFKAERVSRRENFNPSRRLLQHIEAVRAEHGAPRITGYVSGAA